MSAKFITLEGIEGSGKSTQIDFVMQFLHEHEIAAIKTREPGGTELGERIRELLLSNDIPAMHELTELTLMFAARIEHVNRIIKPALNDGKWVVSDRFYDATYAYQGYGRDIDLSKIDNLREYAIGHFEPDITLLLDIDLETSSNRVIERGSQDRFENEKLEFYGKVRAGYLALAQKYANRITVIDSTRSLEQVQSEIASKLNEIIRQ
ncbi:MAG: dTMP kinase [Pseudomonadota bacterium]